MQQQQRSGWNLGEYPAFMNRFRFTRHRVRFPPHKHTANFAGLFLLRNLEFVVDFCVNESNLAGMQLV